MGPEQKIQASITKYLKGLGCKVIKIVSASTSGNSDIVFCYDGYYGEMEVKVPGKHCRKLQLLKAKECTEAGGMWWEVHSLDEAKDAIKEMEFNRHI